MTEKDETGAIPLFANRWDFVLRDVSIQCSLLLCEDADLLNLVFVERLHPVDDDPGKRPAKVDDFVHDKRHYTGGEDIILHVGIPRCPHPLEQIKMDIVLRDLLELSPVGLWRGRKKG